MFSKKPHAPPGRKRCREALFLLPPPAANGEGEGIIKRLPLKAPHREQTFLEIDACGK